MDIRINTTTKKIALMGESTTVKELLELLSDKGLNDYDIVQPGYFDPVDTTVPWGPEPNQPYWRIPSVWHGPTPYITSNTVSSTGDLTESLEGSSRAHHVYAGPPESRVIIRSSDPDSTCQENTPLDKLVCCGEHGCIKNGCPKRK